MELLLSVISIVAYFFGYPTIAGIVGIIATILFVLLYSKQTLWSFCSVVNHFNSTKCIIC